MKLSSSDQFNLHYILVFIFWISPPLQMVDVLVEIIWLQITDLQLKLA